MKSINFFFFLKQLDEVMCKPNYPSIISIDQDSLTLFFAIPFLNRIWLLV